LTIEGALRRGETRRNGTEMDIGRTRHGDLERLRIRLEVRIAAIVLAVVGRSRSGDGDHKSTIADLDDLIVAKSTRSFLRLE